MSHSIDIPSPATASPVAGTGTSTPHTHAHLINLNNANTYTSGQPTGSIDKNGGGGGGRESLMSSTTAFSGVGGQPKDTYHNTGAGCCDDTGTFPSIVQLQQMQVQNNGIVRITLRDWYITNFCTNADVQQMLNLQRFGARQMKFWSRYFLCWSFFGDYMFYITVLPALSWLGFERDGYVLSCMLAIGMWFTDCLKDIFASPRPPSPPVRRSGLSSHALEYGLPSTHSCLAAVLMVELAQFFATAYPSYVWLIWFIAAFSLAHICYSRIWLGMHWPGDVYAGLLCFVFLWLVEVTFFRDFLLHCFDHWGKYPLFFPILFGHVMMVFHATPRGTCPCIEDSARFLGVLVGCTVGQWMRERGSLVDMVSLERYQLIPAAFSFAFLLRFITGIVVIAVTKAATGAFLPKLLRAFFNVSSGSLAPKFSKVPPLLWVYKMSCYAVGLFLGKQLRLEAAPPRILAPFAKPNNPLFSFNNNHNVPILVPVTSTGAINTVATGKGVHGHPIVSVTFATENINSHGTNVTARGGQGTGPKATMNGGTTNTSNAGSVGGGEGALLIEAGSPNRNFYDVVVQTAEETAFGSPTVLAPPQSNPDANVVFGSPNTDNSISPAMGQVGHQIVSNNPYRDVASLPVAIMTPNSTNVIYVGDDEGCANSPSTTRALDGAAAAGGGIVTSSRYGGRYWSLRNHGHWWEHEMQSKYLNYMSIGWAVSLGAPYIINAVWGKYVYPHSY